MSDSQSDRESRAFYDGHYHAGATLVSDVSRHLRRLAHGVCPESRRPVLDVACGSGEWLAAVAETGCEAVGIDIASRAIRVAADRVAGGSFVEGVADALPFRDATFDLVTCLGALEHFADKDAALAEIRRVSRPGAKSLVLVPNAGFLTRRMGLFHGTEQTAVREDVLSLEAWQQLFERNGFIVEARWRDLHVLSKTWLLRRGWRHLPFRLLQALMLAVWPLRWQYQVYHLLCPADGGR